MADSIGCPHCKQCIDMIDGDRLEGHVTYWGQERITCMACPECEKDIYLQEYVNRWWSVGKTEQEARDG